MTIRPAILALTGTLSIAALPTVAANEYGATQEYNNQAMERGIEVQGTVIRLAAADDDKKAAKKALKDKRDALKAEHHDQLSAQKERQNINREEIVELQSEESDRLKDPHYDDEVQIDHERKVGGYTDEEERVQRKLDRKARKKAKRTERLRAKDERHLERDDKHEMRDAERALRHEERDAERQSQRLEREDRREQGHDSDDHDSDSDSDDELSSRRDNDSDDSDDELSSDKRGDRTDKSAQRDDKRGEEGRLRRDTRKDIMAEAKADGNAATEKTDEPPKKKAWWKFWGN